MWNSRLAFCVFVEKEHIGLLRFVMFFEITSLVRFIQLMRLPHHISVPDSAYIRQSAKNNPIFIMKSVYITRGFSECSSSSFSVALSVYSFLCSLLIWKCLDPMVMSVLLLLVDVLICVRVCVCVASLSPFFNGHLFKNYFSLAPNWQHIASNRYVSILFHSFGVIGASHSVTIN